MWWRLGNLELELFFSHFSTLQATHMGWQFISAEHPIKMSGMPSHLCYIPEMSNQSWAFQKVALATASLPGNSYFEIRILKNPDPFSP